MKKRKLNLVIPLIIIGMLLVTTAFQVPVKAATSWSDNFDDGDYDGWTTTGVNSSYYIPEYIDANFTIENGMLKALGPEWNHANHSSNVAYGTWHFDVLAAESSERHLYVIFMSMNDALLDGAPRGYTLMIATQPYGPEEFTGFALLRYNEGIVDIAPLGTYETPTGAIGGYHIDITRNLEGVFNVWINGTYRFSGQDTLHTESETFRFHTPAGSAIDNINVTDTVDLEPPTPTETTSTESTTTSTTTEPSPVDGDITPTILLVGGAAAVVVIVVIAVVFLKRK